MHEFDISQYNKDSSVLKHILDTNMAAADYWICKKCHMQLMRYSVVACCLCTKQVKRYNALTYNSNGNSDINSEASSSVAGERKQFVCKPCNSTLVSQIKCVACNTEKPKHKVLKFCDSKYDRNDAIVQTTLCGTSSDADCICIECDRKLTATNVCTCCHVKLNLYRVIPFSSDNYDFEDYIVSCALASRHRLVNGQIEYICKICDEHLRRRENHTTKMPRKAAACNTHVPGNKFLQAIREKPEFVCTCCHRWLFQKSVMKFSVDRYDMSNAIVKETLDVKYRYPMSVAIFKGMRSAHEHPIDYGDFDSESDDETNVSSGSDSAAASHVLEPHSYKCFEYICVTCDRSLKHKKPRMPAQACANGLMLSHIPPVLLNLSDLERRIISLRLPFMVIFCMVRYGSQYKIRGGCTNVPASLDQIVKMLPRMSSEVQFHPMKLKKKMVYKSSYMYNFIRKDVVMNAIKWLKENNELYSGIELNNLWFDEWSNSEFASFLKEPTCENDNYGHDDVECIDCDHIVCSQHTNTNSLHLSGEDENVNAETSGDIVKGARSSGVDANTEERELIEDCLAAEASLHLTGKPSANVLQFQNLEHEVYTCAPGENNTP